MLPSRALHYTFVSPPRIEFGWSRFSAVGDLARSLGRRAWVVSGSETLRQAGVLDALAGHLQAAGVEVLEAGSIRHEPEVADVDQTVARLRQDLRPNDDLVIAIGGGAALDLGKAVAALATNPHGDTVVDFLEGVGKGLSIEHPPLPVLAIPTTSGTGSEATKNAVISSYDPPFKKSLRSDRMIPRIALIDPELTVSVPPVVTAATGMDAITQLIESYLSRKAQPIPQALCLQGLELAVPAIREAVHNGSSRPAREAMSHAAFLSGWALANSGLGLAHGVAAALGVHCRTTHGLACAVMLPAALRFNAETRRAEIARLAETLTGRLWPNDRTAVGAVIAAIEDLCRDLGIPRQLSQLGVRAEQLPDIVRSSHGNSLSGNPREVSDPELLELLEDML